MVSSRIISSCLAGLALGSVGFAQTSERLSFDSIFEEGAAGRTARQINWAPDGKQLTYRWEDDQGDALFLLDTSTGKETRLLSLGDEEASDLEGLSSVDWSPQGGSLLLVAGSDLYLLPLADLENGDKSKLRRLTETEADEKIPAFSPDGTKVTFVRDQNMYLLDLGGGEETALTNDGKKNEILNGITDWVYWEEIWGRTSQGYWWSPSGKHIAYYRFDDRDVPSYPLVDFTTTYPTVEWQRYPKAGETNPTVRVGVLALETGETTWMNTGTNPDVYLARVDWRTSGDQVAIQRLNRDQNVLDLLLCDPTNGNCTTLLTETSETWININDDFRFLPDNRFIWASEQSGWNKLYLYNPTGQLERSLTPEGWTVGSVSAVSQDGTVTYSAFSTGGMGALHRQVFRQSLEGGDPVALTPESTWARATVSDTSGAAVVTTSSSQQPAEVKIVSADGEKAGDLPTKPAKVPAHSSEWTFFEVGDPGETALPAALLKPVDFDPSIKYPVIMYHYGCPASQVVADRGTSRRDMWHRMMTERGYAVLMIDNPGSNFFGKQGAERAYRRFGKGNLAAQLEGVEYLKTLDWVDPDRIGLWGWSGGGSNTLYALLNSPGTWKAGVSGAPVTDWRLYDTIWTERYLDHPDDNPEGYTDSSPVTYADKLEDALLIVHGTADDNVHPQNTIVMSRALLDAGVPFEQAIHPRQKHGFKTEDSRHFYERMTEFFDRHLKDDTPVVSQPALD